MWKWRVEDNGEFGNPNGLRFAGVDFIKTRIPKRIKADAKRKIVYNELQCFNPKKRAAIVEIGKRIKCAQKEIRIDGDWYGRAINYT